MLKICQCLCKSIAFFITFGIIIIIIRIIIIIITIITIINKLSMIALVNVVLNRTVVVYVLTTVQ